ncbi:MAG: alpha/beta hydrolase [Halobacteriales archaeon]|nr:alpha/beta hydrolase [Halobacteriales archaeon]
MTEHRTTDGWYDAGRLYEHENDDHDEPVDVFYVEENPDADETVVLVHGFPTSSWDWTKVWDELAEEFHVVALDMVGFGFSDKPSGYPYSLFDQADLHEELLGDLGVESAHVLAHDYGDTVVQELLARQNEGGETFEIRDAVLLNGGIFYEAQEPTQTQELLLGPDGAEIARAMTRDAFGAAFADVFADGTRPSEEELDGFWELINYNDGNEVMHEVIEYLHERRDNRDRWASALQEAEMPLKFAVGPEDPVSGERMARRYEEVVPNPDVERFEGVGHYPQWEAPDAVLDTFFGFVG